MLLAIAAQIGADVALVSEPNKTLCEDMEGCFLDQNHRAAIMITNSNLQTTKIAPANNNGFKWIEVEGVRIYSVYWRPAKTNEDFDRYTNFLDRLETSVKETEGPVVVAGDFNAKSPKWGALREDRSVRVLTDSMTSMDLVVCNIGDSPTFERTYPGGVSRSHIDITFVSELHRRLVCNWKVLNDYTRSLHRYISFSVASSIGCPTQPVPISRWAWKKCDVGKVLEFLRSLVVTSVTKAELVVKELTTFLEEACNSCMPKGTYKWGKNLCTGGQRTSWRGARSV